MSLGLGFGSPEYRQELRGLCMRDLGAEAYLVFVSDSRSFGKGLQRCV